MSSSDSVGDASMSTSICNNKLLVSVKLDAIVKYILYRHITKHLIDTLDNLIAIVEWFNVDRQSICLYVGNMLYILLRNYSS